MLLTILACFIEELRKKVGGWWNISCNFSNWVKTLWEGWPSLWWRIFKLEVLLVGENSERELLEIWSLLVWKESLQLTSQVEPTIAWLEL